MMDDENYPKKLRSVPIHEEYWNQTVSNGWPAFGRRCIDFLGTNCSKFASSSVMRGSTTASLMDVLMDATPRDHAHVNGDQNGMSLAHFS